MRKIIVPLFLIIVVGGYSAYWFKKADEFKHTLEETITSINNNGKSFGTDSPLIRYTSIETSGFPFAITLQVNKPIVDLPVSAFLQKLPQLAPPVTAAPLNWVEEIGYGESVSVSSNIIGSHFTLVVAGDRTQTLLVNNTARHSLTSTSKTPLTCNLNMQPSLHFPQDLQAFLGAFAAVDCNVENFVLKDAASGATLLTADGVHIAANKERDGSNITLGLQSESNHAKAAPAFDAIMADYMDMIYTLKQVPSAQRLPLIPASQYGEQNAKVDLRYTGPTETKDFSDPDMHVRFDINALNLTSDLFDIGIEMHVATMPQADKRIGTFIVHSHIKTTAAYDSLIAKQLAAGFAAGIAQNAQGDASSEISQMMHQLGSPEELANTLLPKLNTLGNITLDINTAVTGPKDPSSFIKDGNITVDAFNWLATPYGIKMTANSIAGTDGKKPSGTFSVTCLNCDALMNDLGDYAMRVEKVIDRLKPETRPTITPELVDGLKQFLHGISDNSTDKDITIHLVMKDTGEFTISGKQVPELIRLFAMTVGPHLSQSAPALQPSPLAPPQK